MRAAPGEKRVSPCPALLQPPVQPPPHLVPSSKPLAHLLPTARSLCRFPHLPPVPWACPYLGGCEGGVQLLLNGRRMVVERQRRERARRRPDPVHEDRLVAPVVAVRLLGHVEALVVLQVRPARRTP